MESRHEIDFLREQNDSLSDQLDLSCQYYLRTAPTSPQGMTKYSQYHRDSSQSSTATVVRRLNNGMREDCINHELMNKYLSVAAGRRTTVSREELSNDCTKNWRSPQDASGTCCKERTCGTLLQ